MTLLITLLIAWLATAIGLGFAILIVSGIQVKNLSGFIIAAAALGVINAFLRPVLWFLTAPLSVLSFGIFALIINALMIMLAASIVPNFTVKGFGSAFWGALIMAIVGAIAFIAVPLLSGADINWYSYEYHTQTYP